MRSPSTHRPCASAAHKCGLSAARTCGLVAMMGGDRVFALVERWRHRLAVESLWGPGAGMGGQATGPGGGPEAAAGRAGGAAEMAREGDLTHQADRDVGARSGYHVRHNPCLERSVQVLGIYAKFPVISGPPQLRILLIFIVSNVIIYWDSPRKKRYWLTLLRASQSTLNISCVRSTWNPYVACKIVAHVITFLRTNVRYK